MYTVYTSQVQLEPLPAKRDNFFHMNRTKLFGESKYFLANRDNFFPCEQALVRFTKYTSQRETLPGIPEMSLTKITSVPSISHCENVLSCRLFYSLRGVGITVSLNTS